MKLNEHARELTGRPDEYGEWLYWMSIFGQPSLNEPWGWQVDGHHLIINCFILGDQLVLTPDFRGSEPTTAKSGKYAGTRVLREEESRGLQLMNALTVDQKKQAIIGAEVPRDVVTTAQVDNIELKFSGIGYEALNPMQQELLLKIIDVYVGRIRPGHAEIRIEEVKKHLSRTHFGWIGECENSKPFYYRIHSPVILIEFDHLPGTIWNNTEPNSRSHPHNCTNTERKRLWTRLAASALRAARPFAPAHPSPTRTGLNDFVRPFRKNGR